MIAMKLKPLVFPLSFFYSYFFFPSRKNYIVYIWKNRRARDVLKMVMVNLTNSGRGLSKELSKENTEGKTERSTLYVA